MKLLLKRNSFRNGFTLAELMVVISIIGFLGALIIFFLRTQALKANDAKKKTEIKRIAVAVEEYEKDHDCYPLPNQVVCSNGGTGLRPYLDKIPCDPVTNSSYYYDYENSSCPKWYRIYTNLQNDADNDYDAGIGPNYAFSYEYSSPNAPDAPKILTSTATSAPGAPSPSPSPQTTFYGCFSGTCQMIQWNSSRPGPECDPNFQNSNCYGVCGNLNNECQTWH